MTSETTNKINAFSTDPRRSNALLALLNYYDKGGLMNISEQEALIFLSKLESGEIKIDNYFAKGFVD